MKKYLDLAIANEQIKTTDIKGKDYAEVNQRIKAFRMVYPQGTIQTQMTSNENGVCIFQARIYDEDNKLLGTGTAYEKENSSFINKTSYIENCETSAVGRALGMCGFGIDVSVASAEEMQNAINNQTVTQEEADCYEFDFGKYKGKTLLEVYTENKKYIEWLMDNTKDERMLKLIELATGLKTPSEDEQKETLDKLSEFNSLLNKYEALGYDRESIYSYYGVSSNKNMTLEQLTDAIEKIKSNMKKVE